MGKFTFISVFIDAPNRVPPINGGDEPPENTAGSISEGRHFIIFYPSQIKSLIPYYM